MLYICHRINTMAELENVPDEYGVEVDLRDDLEGNVYIEHNPFTRGENFEEYLKKYSSDKEIILNIKSERIEYAVLELLNKYQISSYFFLDSSFPMIATLAEQGNSQIAVRFSEYEGMDLLENMAGKVQWVWVDCFTKMPLTTENYLKIKQLGYKICIVSPELQGQQEKIETYAGYLKKENLIPDAICTKQYNIELWKKYFK